MTQEAPLQATAPFATGSRDLPAGERALRQARLHLTEAINHSVAGHAVRAEDRLDEAALLAYDHAPLPLWVELCEARVRHVRGSHREAREQVRELAQHLDAEIEVVGE